MTVATESTIVFYLGTRKLSLLVGDLSTEEPRVIGRSDLFEPEGFDKGLVVNLESAITTVERLLDRLFPERGLKDISAYVVLGNSKLSGYSYSSSQYYQGSPRVVSAHEIRSVIDQTRSVATLPLSESILQVVPESFLVNDMEGIRNPLGLEAGRLGVNLKIFTMNSQDFKNMTRVFEAASVEVLGYWPKALTVSEAVLTDNEKEEGSLLIDIADDMTQLILWKNGMMRGSRVLRYGGKNLTQEISNHWKIEFHDAQKVKERFASLELAPQFGEELIPLVDRNGKTAQPISRKEFHTAFLDFGKKWLDDIVQAAAQFAHEEKLIYPHYVFTGGGTCLEGFLEFLQSQFGREARIGLSRRVEAPNELLVDSAMTGALGMYRWLVSHERNYEKLVAPRNFFEKSLTSAKNWFCTYF